MNPGPNIKGKTMMLPDESNDYIYDLEVERLLK